MPPALYSLDFTVHVSLRYHARRRAFFDAAHRISIALVAVGGSAGFVAILGDETTLAKFVTAFLAVVATLDLVIGYSERARDYDSLYRRFSDLAVSIAGVTDPSEDQIREWTSERMRIEKDEPTSIDVLNVICHNEEAEARGQSESKFKVRWWQRPMCHLVTLPPNHYES